MSKKSGMGKFILGAGLGEEESNKKVNKKKTVKKPSSNK